ncbi:reducing type I polyketide synthase [Mollisia scopiformis]|uniref:Reducing type I polyketide synthase n=1 Tax=Mollisia scopiformis TaxID=149040 RepID=A0A194XHC2_MOLSC|nr:reducing type I polyketide synthase [Mollisia scopiformis]KUJ19541.1 reducing type I polyketide synthase [Mollisia scopiformis]
MHEKDILEPIAVVGISFKFPQEATSEASLWELMIQKRCVATKFPEQRFNIDAFHSSDSSRMNKISTHDAHFLKGDIRDFDAPFFSIPPLEAATLDPQQRSLLETTYRALENAGIPMESVKRSKISVHVGCFTNDFMTMSWRDSQQVPKYSGTGSAGSILSNRISWFFDLAGPSITIDTACSSSMAALDLSCQGLWSGESTMGIVAGSSLILTPEMNIALSNMNFLSPDGRCYSFDDRSNGYGRGEGFGVLILKPISQAIQDGDTIRALIRSTGTNQDGHTPGGVTQPSKDSQAKLITETYRKAGLDMGWTRFVEAHGTGTALGDPIEARAIGESFRKYQGENDGVYIGAVKSNIGHLEGTSGIAGVIKTVLALERGVIPPNTNFEVLNPQIDAEGLKIKFPVESIPWPSHGIRRASVNSFGFGGTNAHAVLDDAYHYLSSRHLSANHCTAKSLPGRFPLQATNGFRTPSGEVQSAKLLVWSAADEDGIHRLAAEYGQYLCNLDKKDEVKFLSDLAFTLNIRRSSLPWKSFTVADSVSKLEKSLLEDTLSQPIRSPTQKPTLGFVFTGQGAQWWAMGRELSIYPAFRASLRDSEEHLQQINCSWSLEAEMARDKMCSRINEPELSQTISTAVQIAIVDLLGYVGIVPSTVVGHSSGEIAAAYCIGALSKKSALKVAYFRGKLACKLTDCLDPKSKHSMVAVGTSPGRIYAILETLAERFGLNANLLTVSCINSPNNVTISGPEVQIDALTAHLNHEKIFARKLMVKVGYHSPQMNRISCEYLEHLRGLQKGTLSKAQMMSTVTCKTVSADVLLTGQYWVENMVSPVNFLGAMRNCSIRSSPGGRKLDKSHLREIVVSMWLEIGPHSALQGPIRDILSSVKRSHEVTYSSVLVRNRSALETFLTSAGTLHCQGFQVDLQKVNRLDPCASLPLVLPDLPHYPFNHSVVYWEESRIGKTFRCREYGNHDLLGSRVDDWNPLEGTWRMIIRAEEMPWVKEHRVNGSILYPAAGMLVMAIEAAKQLDDTQFAIGYEISDVSFHTALIISQENVETQICLRPSTDTANKKHLSYEFRIYFHNSFDQKWEEVCRGCVRADFGRTESDVSVCSETSQELEHLRNVHARSVAEPHQSMEPARMYQMFKKVGLEYGPNFQQLTDIRFNNAGEAMSTVTPSTWSREWSGNAAQSHVVHPTTLDSMFQLVFVALSNGVSKTLQTMVPRRMQKLWISSTGVGTSFLGSLQAHAEACCLSRRSATCSISVMGGDDSLKVRIQGFEITAVSSPQSISQEQKAKRLCYETRWDVDPQLLDLDQILRHCKQAYVPREEPIDFAADCESFVLSCASIALAELKQLNRLPAPALARYATWLQGKLDSDLAKFPPEYRPCRTAHLGNSANLEELRGRVATNHQGRLFEKVGKALSQILLGDVDPLQVLFEDEQLVANFYQEVNEHTQIFAMFSRFLDSLLHKNPGMKILEIGAGTGGTTGILHQTSAPDPSHPRYSEYHFTDISPSFFAKGREKFQHNGRMSFSVLDIERDIFDQGFQGEYYDLIIASNVLHATRSLSKTIGNTRKLLKPGGLLLLVELTVPDLLPVPFVFGTLPGWWLSSEHYRPMGPLINVEQWDVVLKENGFSGTDLVLRDYQSEACHTASLMLSTATGSDKASESDLNSKTIVVIDENSSFQRNMVAALVSELKVCAALTKEQVSTMPNRDQYQYIILIEVDGPVLSMIDSQAFISIQSFLCSSKGILWVTGGGGRKSVLPDYGMAQGLFTVLRLENGTIPMSVLGLEVSPDSLCQEHARNIAAVFKSMTSARETAPELEYVEVDGLLHINRIYEAKSPNEHVFDQTIVQSRIQQFGEGPAIKLSAEVPGLDCLQFIEDSEHDEPMAPGEVEVQVHAIGVNFKDLLTVLGRVDSDVLGCECSGIISRVGEDCGSLKLGDRVTMISFGAYRTYARSKVDCVIKIPDEMTFVEAAAIPTVFCTAFYSLCEIARLEKGESILIHAASGGTGQASIQIARQIGAEIFATVGSVDKKLLLMDKYGIAEDHIFYSRDTSFAEGIQRMTNNRGVDVILNSLSGEGLLASWQCIAQYGRFLEIGKKDINDHGSLPLYPFHKNALFAGIDLTCLVINRPHLIQRILQQVMSMFSLNQLSAPYPLHVFPISDTEKAFRFLQGGKSSGKIVLKIEEKSKVLTSLTTKSAYRFKNNVTYVISGGLGGLGRSISRWMVARGARNLILLSRSGPASNVKAQELLAELRKKGVHVVAPACDITCLPSLQKILDDYKDEMPPIMGCFQGAMVLKDATFAAMSFQDWKTCTMPKVQGSWNLHTLLPKGLEFFILLSSTCGIYGNPGQSNYAAGNTYQAALTNYRVSQGEKATTIDLGVVLSEGFVAENAHIMEHLKRVGVLDSLSLDELFALLDYYCDPAFSPETTMQSHVTTGISLPTDIRAQGGEVPYALQQPVFLSLHQIDSSTKSTIKISEHSQDFKALFASAASLKDAGLLVSEGLCKKLSRVLGIPKETIALNGRVDSYGVDSLAAVELKNWLSREMSADVAVFEILGGPTLIDVGLTTAAKSAFRKDDWTN